MPTTTQPHTNTLNQTISDHTLLLATRNHINRQELAQRIGRSNTYLRERLTNTKHWDTNDIERLAHTLHTTTDDLTTTHTPNHGAEPELLLDPNITSLARTDPKAHALLITLAASHGMSREPADMSRYELTLIARDLNADDTHIHTLVARGFLTLNGSEATLTLTPTR